MTRFRQERRRGEHDNAPGPMRKSRAITSLVAKLGRSIPSHSLGIKLRPYTACALSSGSTAELMPAANCCEKSGLRLRDDGAGDDLIAVEPHQKHGILIDDVGPVIECGRRRVSRHYAIAVGAGTVELDAG